MASGGEERPWEEGVARGMNGAAGEWWRKK